MFTPQQIDQISFGRSTFGGYDMQQVDEFLEPLTEDYVTLYKENALLKSKMRVLVGKLEEYRKNEASMKEAVANAQKTCDKMVMEAEAKCAKMMANANASVSANTAVAAEASRNSDALVAAENARVEEARRSAAAKINELQDQLRTCIQALERIKGANAPVQAPAAAAPVMPVTPVAPVVPAAPAVEVKSDDVADEIAQNIEAMIGTTVDTVSRELPFGARQQTGARFPSPPSSAPNQK